MPYVRRESSGAGNEQELGARPMYFFWPQQHREEMLRGASSVEFDHLKDVCEDPLFIGTEAVFMLSMKEFHNVDYDASYINVAVANIPTSFRVQVPGKGMKDLFSQSSLALCSPFLVGRKGTVASLHLVCYAPAQASDDGRSVSYYDFVRLHDDGVDEFSG